MTLTDWSTTVTHCCNNCGCCTLLTARTTLFIVWCYLLRHRQKSRTTAKATLWPKYFLKRTAPVKTVKYSHVSLSISQLMHQANKFLLLPTGYVDTYGGATTQSSSHVTLAAPHFDSLTPSNKTCKFNLCQQRQILRLNIVQRVPEANRNYSQM